MTKFFLKPPDFAERGHILPVKPPRPLGIPGYATPKRNAEDSKGVRGFREQEMHAFCKIGGFQKNFGHINDRRFALFYGSVGSALETPKGREQEYRGKG